MKDAKGHGSNKRGQSGAERAKEFQAAQDRVKEFQARSAARQAELVAGGKSPIDAFHQTGREFQNGPPGGYGQAKVADIAQQHGIVGPAVHNYGRTIGTGPTARPMVPHPDSPDGRAARYNADAVNNAIASSNRAGRRIGGKEARAIHRLLKGRG